MKRLIFVGFVVMMVAGWVSAANAVYDPDWSVRIKAATTADGTGNSYISYCMTRNATPSTTLAPPSGTDPVVYAYVVNGAQNLIKDQRTSFTGVTMDWVIKFSTNNYPAGTAPTTLWAFVWNPADTAIVKTNAFVPTGGETLKLYASPDGINKGALLWTAVNGGTGAVGDANTYALGGTTGFSINDTYILEVGDAPSPIVVDDGATTTNNTQLHASWSVPEGYSVLEYQYAVGTSPTDLIVDWKSAGVATESTETGLSLQVGSTYYWYVKERNYSGDWSARSSSDGITVVRPSAPAVTDSGVYTTSSADLHASWSASDPWGVSAYEYAIGTSPTNLILDWKPAGTATEATEAPLGLEVGQKYYWYVKAQNTPGLWSSAGSSNGIIAAAVKSVGEGRRLASGTPLWLADVRVTSLPADLPGFWVESNDRSSGIKIPASWTVVRGDTLTVAGLLTWTDGVPSLSSPELESPPAAGTLWKPPYSHTRTLGADPREDLAYAAFNPVGLLFTTYGRVKKVDTANHVFYIDDGTGLADGMGPSYDPFVGLRVAYKAGTIPPAPGKRVLVTGIRTTQKTTLQYDAWVNKEYRFEQETLYLPLLVPRDTADVLPLN